MKEVSPVLQVLTFYQFNEQQAMGRGLDWMPFGGRYESGLGMGGVKYAIHEMTHPKLIVLNL